MPRGKRKPTEDNSVHARIRQAEKTISTGIRETVYVSDEQLETVLKLIEKHGMTKAQVLRKAVRLGLEVLSQDLNPNKEEPSRGYSDETLDILVGIEKTPSRPKDGQVLLYETMDRLGIPREALTGGPGTLVEVDSPFVTGDVAEPNFL